MRSVATAVLLLGLFAAPAAAQQSLPGNFPAQGDGPALGAVDGTQGWNQGTTRGFVAGSFDLGFLYIRPRFSAGWGKPHFKWFGLDVNPIVSPGAIGAYLGLRIDHPYVNWRIGARMVLPFSRSYMEDRPNDEDFDRTDLNRDVEGEDGFYLSAESELTLSIPVGSGMIFSETALTYITLVPDDVFVYEDTIKVIAEPPWVWRQRIGYMASFGETGAVRVGLVAELVGVPKRDMVVVRGGLLLRVWVSPRVEVRGSWIPMIAGRDKLGINGGDFGLLGLRYRWSTGGVSGQQRGDPAVFPESREGEESPVN
jgi:hypothetical protein